MWKTRDWVEGLYLLADRWESKDSAEGSGRSCSARLHQDLDLWARGQIKECSKYKWTGVHSKTLPWALNKVDSSLLPLSPRPRYWVIILILVLFSLPNKSSKYWFSWQFSLLTFPALLVFWLMRLPRPSCQQLRYKLNVISEVMTTKSLSFIRRIYSHNKQMSPFGHILTDYSKQAGKRSSPTSDLSTRPWSCLSMKASGFVSAIEPLVLKEKIWPWRLPPVPQRHMDTPPYPPDTQDVDVQRATEDVCDVLPYSQHFLHICHTFTCMCVDTIFRPLFTMPAHVQYVFCALSTMCSSHIPKYPSKYPVR